VYTNLRFKKTNYIEKMIETSPVIFWI